MSRQPPDDAPPRTPPAAQAPTVGDTGVADTRDDTHDERRAGAPRPTPGEARDLPFVDPGHYQVAGEHACGGLGRVLRARDLRLERTVALKELAHAPSARASSRFVREALVTARLQHPGIVPVYEAGRWPSGEPFYAMKLVSGQTLDDAIDLRPALEQRLALLPHVLAVAEAIAYAHSEGVIHRDLKPANVMIGGFGETVVIDWGLAKDRRLADEPTDAAEDDSLYAQAHADKTRVGTVVGTPAYMAPEQARGEAVDERADVYALGAMLYHLLAAVPPFEGAPDTVVARVAREAPVPVGERAREAPRDLVAIVDKAMARDASRRYPTAKELAQDLSRFLTGQLVGARAYGRLTLISRWLRRHRLPVGIAAVLLAALAVTAAISARRVVRERNLARARSAELTLTQARSMLERDPTAALAWLKQYPDDGADWVGVRSVAADAYSRGVARHVLAGHPEGVNAAVFSADGTLAATASYDLVQLWDVATGAPRARLRLAPISQLAFSPDDASLAIGGLDGEIWTLPTNARDASEARALGKHQSWVSNVSFSADGKTLVTAAADGKAILWDVATGQGRKLEGHAALIGWLELVDSGHGLVTASQDGDVRRWDLGSGSSRPLFAVSRPRAMALAANGDRAAIAAEDRVLLWDAVDPEPRELGRHQGVVSHVAFLADGRVVSGGEDTTIRVWTVSGDPPQTWRAHERPITAVTVAPDGSTVASADARGDIRVWQGGASQLLRGHGRAVTRLVFSRDGHSLLSGSDDGTARVWPITAHGAQLRVSADEIFRVAFRRDGRTIVTTGRDGGVRSLGLDDGSISTLGGHAMAAFDLELLPDGTRFVTGSWDGLVTLWQGDDGEPARVMRHDAQIWAVAVSPDGRRAASAASDGDVRLWDLANGQGEVLHRHGDDAADVVFSPDGRHVASSGTDFAIRVRDLSSGRDRELRGRDAVEQVLVFSIDGRTIFSGGLDGKVHAWDVATGARILLGEHESRVRTLALSTDGTWLASGASDKVIHLWNLTTGERRELRGHEGEVRHLTFSPDGKLLASAGWDDTVRLWSLQDGHVAIMRGHVGRVHRVAFSPDGRLLASAGQDGMVGVWKVEDAARVPQRPALLRRWLDETTTARVPGTIAPSE